MKRLTRSNEKQVAGVISGISYFVNPELDPLILRLAFAISIFFLPYLILIYFGMALIIPNEDVNYSK